MQCAIKLFGIKLIKYKKKYIQNDWYTILRIFLSMTEIQQGLKNRNAARKVVLQQVDDAHGISNIAAATTASAAVSFFYHLCKRRGTESRLS